MTPELILIQDASIYIVPTIRLPLVAEEVLGRLIAETPWRAESIVLWGKKYLQPRLIAWFADTGIHYTYSKIRLDPLPWTDLLQGIRREVERVAKTSFNSVLINYYRNQNDSMGMHSDDEPELGTNPVIASLSVGDPRIFILKHRVRKDLKTIRIKLNSASLLVMQGNTQENWRHGIPKERRPCGPRVNLTFRQIISRDITR